MFGDLYDKLLNDGVEPNIIQSETQALQSVVGTKAVYRNTYKGLFDNEPMRLYRSGGKYGEGGTWFTVSKSDASGYSDKQDPLYSAYVNVQNPLELRISVLGEDKWLEVLEKIIGKSIENIFYLSGEDRRTILQYAKDNGFDSVFMADTDASGKNAVESLVVFDKKNIYYYR